MNSDIEKFRQLWLDDIHSPSVSAVTLHNPVWFKTGNDFISGVKNLIDTGEDKAVSIISFDNDLGEESGDIDGYTCFNYIEEVLHGGAFPNLHTIIIHSDNTSAVTKMMSAAYNLESNFNIKVVRFRRQVV